MQKTLSYADAKSISSTKWWFIASAAVTVLLILLLIANLYFSLTLLNSFEKRDLIAERASWQLRLQAESMDKTARVSTLSGNLQWKEAYQSSHPELEEIMQEISRVAKGVVSPEEIQELQAYFEKLQNLENQVYALVSASNKGLALQILDSWEYTKNRQAFENSAVNIVESIQKSIQDKIESYNQLAMGFLGIFLFCLTLFLSFWGFTYRLWRGQVRLKQAAEESLRYSEEKYRKLIDTFPDSIALVDENGQILAANPVLGERLGQGHENLEGKRLQDVMPQEETDKVMQQGTRALELQEAVYQQEQSQDKFFESYYVPIYALQARNSFQIVSKDVTERIKAEAEKEQLRSQMLQARKMQSIGILSAGVAHEFNNLLQVMSGNIQLLLMCKSVDGMEYQRLKSVEKAINRAANFVKQLLLFSRKSEASRRYVDLRQGVEESVRILEQTIPRMVQIQCNLADDLWPIYADPVQLEQVVLNLGKNAADAMPQGGRIHIEAKNVHLSNQLQTADSVLKPGDYVLLNIKDTGHGMEPETLEHIFEPFFTTKEVGSGTGLGLSTVYGIVQAHQGHIQCHSQPGEGATFSIYWPSTRSQDKAEQKQEESAGELPQGTGTILVVDDEGAYRDMMQIALSQSGYTVLAAANGEEALQIYSRQSAQIDLVILDLSMDGMGGEQCLQEILKADPGARILVASGYSTEKSTLHDILQGEAVDFIGKPFQLSALMHKVQEILKIE